MTAYAVAVSSSDEPPNLSEDSLSFSGTGDFFEALEFGERDRVDLLNNSSPTIDGYRYRLLAQENYGGTGHTRDLLEILPLAGEELFITILYLPSLDLTSAGSPADVRYAGVKGIAEEWMILDVLLTLCGKTNEHSGLWERRKAEIEAQFRQQVADRDSAQPARIRQVWHRTGAGRPVGRLDVGGGRWPWR